MARDIILYTISQKNFSRVTGVNCKVLLGTAAMFVTKRIDAGSADETKIIFSLSTVTVDRDISVTDACITSPAQYICISHKF